MVSEEPPASGESWGNADGMLAGFFAGTRLAGYRLEEQVGAGGMAMVFRAVDGRLDRLVALKVLAPAVAWDEAFRQRFIRESRVAAAIDDPHIIPVYEAGQAGGVLFIAMRYVPGGDVSGLLRRDGALPPDRAAAVISPVASALDAAPIPPRSNSRASRSMAAPTSTRWPARRLRSSPATRRSSATRPPR